MELKFRMEVTRIPPFGPPLAIMRWLLLGLCLFLGGASCDSRTKTVLPTAWIEVGGKKIQVEIADTIPAQTMGLMYRKELGKDQGMIFVFDSSKQRAFWMKNTLIPLSIAFMDEKGGVLNILEMSPLTEQNYYSKGPAKYALEMNSRWFEKSGVKPGDRLKGLEALAEK